MKDIKKAIDTNNIADLKSFFNKRHEKIDAPTLLINIRGQDYQATPLHYAIATRNLRIALFLIDTYKVNPYLKTTASSKDQSLELDAFSLSILSNMLIICDALLQKYVNASRDFACFVKRYLKKRLPIYPNAEYIAIHMGLGGILRFLLQFRKPAQDDLDCLIVFCKSLSISQNPNERILVDPSVINAIDNFSNRLKPS